MFLPARRTPNYKLLLVTPVSPGVTTLLLDWFRTVPADLLLVVAFVEEVTDIVVTATTLAHHLRLL